MARRKVHPWLQYIGINKDHPGRPHFKEAFNAAEASSKEYVADIIHALKFRIKSRKYVDSLGKRKPFLVCRPATMPSSL